MLVGWLQESVFCAVNKVEMESTLAFLSALESASSTPDRLKTDVSQIVLVLRADTADVSEVSNAVQMIESIKRSTEAILAHI